MGDSTSAAELRAQAVEKLQKEADETNKARTGKGTRVMVNQTRGKNPQPITWEGFAKDKPETLPATITEFMEVSKVQDEPTLVSYLIDGFNQNAYSNASDPIAEFVNPAWSEDMQKQFRLTVRNYANATGLSLDESVALIKPGIEKAHEKALAAAKASA